MARIFVSYSTKDSGFAEKLRSFLIRDKIDVWMAPYSITPGKEFAEEIVHGIQDSDLFLLLLSKASNDSPHVLREVSMAVSQNKKIISLRIEDVKPSLSMAYYLESIQWYDALSRDDETMNQLVSDLKKIMENVAAVSPVREKIEEQPPASRFSGNKKKIIGMVAGAAVVAAVAVGVVVGTMNHSSTDSDKNVQLLAYTQTAAQEQEEVSLETGEETSEETAMEEESAETVMVDGNKAQEGPEVEEKEGKDKKNSEKAAENSDAKNKENKKSKEEKEDSGNSTPVISHNLSSGKKPSGGAQDLSPSASSVEDSDSQNSSGKKDSPKTASGEETDKTEKKDSQKKEEQAATAADQLSIGSLLRFGTYRPVGYEEGNNDDKIDWIVLDVDKKNETALLLSASILDVKAFDVAESGECQRDKKGNIYNKKESYKDEIMTEFYGNSDWSSSNIRTWLNSDKARVSYADQPPVTDGTSILENGYEKQPGFLARFSEAEKKRLLVRENKTTGNSMQPSVVTSSERVFLLSVDEVDRYLVGNNISMYAPLTKSAHNSDASPWTEIFDERNASCYMWVLRTPANDNAYNVMVIGGDIDYVEDYSFNLANTCAFGIRPAVQLNLKNASLSGDGSEGTPFVLN